MKNILMLIIISVLVILFGFCILNAQANNSKNPISSELKFDSIPDKYSILKENTNIYRYILSEYSDKIIIQKDVKKDEVIKGSTVNPNLFKRYELDSQVYLNNESKHTNFNISIDSSSPFELFVYDLSSCKDGMIEKSRFNTLYSIVNKDGYSIWSIFTDIKNRDKVLDVSKQNDNYIILSIISDNNDIVSRINEHIFVDFTTDKKVYGKYIIYRYSLPIDYFQSNHSGIIIPLPISGKIINDNVIKLEYADGSVEYWKIKLTEKDIEKTKDINPSNEIDKRLIWWNGIEKGSPINHEDAKSWDYNEDINHEPIFKDML